MNEFLKRHGQLLLGAAAVGVGHFIYNRFVNLVYDIAEEAAQDVVEDVIEQMNEVGDELPEDDGPRILNSFTLSKRLQDEEEQ